MKGSDRTQFHLKGRRKWLLLFFLPELFFFLLLLLNSLFPLPKEKSFSRVVLAGNGELLAAYLSRDDKWRMETKVEDVPPELVRAILAKEDKYFYLHPGINPIAVVRALISNVFHARRISGASTITMQVARLMEPADRTYLNKLSEMLRALQLEWNYPKKRILELYMSYVPYGGNIEGIKAASLIYFDRQPAKLSLAQSILLTVIPNRPNSLRLDKAGEEVRKARNKWIKMFLGNKTFPAELLKDALDEPIIAKRHVIQPRAPHFSLYVQSLTRDNEIRTTLDPAIQQKAEKLLFNHVQRVLPKDISNGAVIVIDNRTMEVKAYCGSADFYNSAASGQVNGIRAYRSPGSSLKPFLYALAMDKGMITPKSKLLDVPTNFNGYVPENFDLQYRGDVTAEYALVQSLNIPAIRLLNDYGTKSFIDFLGKDGGMQWIKAQKRLGLSIILGGCGVNLAELARLYTIFGNEGQLRPLKYLADNQKEGEAKKLISPEAAWLITDILSYNLRPDLPAYLIDNSDLPKIAWKTGTSFGKKDAWAVGVSPRYTIGVWMGNFDGHGAAALTGAETAVPLLFDLFNSIDVSKRKSWFLRPNKIYERKICRESGMPATPDCANTVTDYAILNKSADLPCDLHKAIFVDKNEHIQYCTACLPVSGYHKVMYSIYPAELALWMQQNGKAFKLPPPHNPGCNGRFSTEGPQILSPSPAFEYFIDEDAPQQIMLQAASDPSVHWHYWYIDKKFYQKTASGDKLFFLPHAGSISIACMDDKGRSESIVIKVKKL